MKQEEQIISRYDAVMMLEKFLKRRKGKVLNEKHLNDFSNLTDKLWSNFKSSNEKALNSYEINYYENYQKAMKCLKSGFIKFEDGSFYKYNKIESFAFYTDDKYKIKIENELITITENDFNLLKLLNN